MTDYADLEIGLERYTQTGFRLEMRFTEPGKDVDIRETGELPVTFALEALRLAELELDDAAYGRTLSKGLFAEEKVRMVFAKAKTQAQSLSVPLRLRLLIDAEAQELHHLHWEKLSDPEDEAALCNRERLFFSRYLSSSSWRPLIPQPRSEMKALIAVASPEDLATHQFGQIDTATEVRRAQEGLRQIPILKVLPNGDRVTLTNLLDCLREGYDILYLVCHGSFKDGEPWLWLEDDSGKTARVSGRDFARLLSDLEKLPRLIVLASCESAGSGVMGDGRALASLGPRLAEAGIPAVLAMQGKVAVATIAPFMSVFFRELERDGQIDRAMAAARLAIRDRDDWWMPVLFMRLKSGRLWYVPGFAEEQERLEKWPALLRYIRQGKCTPILGPEITQHLFGSQQKLARVWAEKYHFPLAPHQREELVHVAQYLTINQDENYPRDELKEYMLSELQERYCPRLSADEQIAFACGQELTVEERDALLTKLISTAGKYSRSHDPDEPHAVLASLPLPIYITTDFSNMLLDALRDAGKEPHLMLAPWKEELTEISEIAWRDSKYSPTKEEPLVYHLFGHLDYPDSLVLTENDYFTYLTGTTRNKELIPEEVRGRLADSALLFLGFRLYGWDFRIIFHSLLSSEGDARRERFSHVAAQISPEEGSILDPERAKGYLVKYFGKENISVFWGSAEDFVRELRKQRAGGGLK